MAAAGFALARGGAAVVDPRLLARELPPRGEALRVDCGLDGAAGLAVVCAVREAAARGERVDLRERAVGPAVPEADLAHAGRVEEQRAARHRQQLTRDRRVSAATVARADGTRVHPLGAQERVRQRRLARTGRPEEHRCRPGPQRGPERADARGGRGAAGGVPS